MINRNTVAAGRRSSKRSSSVKALLAKARRLSLEDSAPQALERAFTLLLDASKKGSAEADYAIGTWYGFGKYLPQDDEKAAGYFRRAARKNYGPALFNLAVSYETGRGVAKDVALAFNLYLRAAREGNMDAANSVSRCLYYGIGVIRNKPLAELVADLLDGTFARKRELAPSKG